MQSQLQVMVAVVLLAVAGGILAGILAIRKASRTSSVASKIILWFAAGLGLIPLALLVALMFYLSQMKHNPLQ